MEQESKTFNSLNELRAYKETIQQNIDKDEVEIKKCWNALFKKPKQRVVTPAQRITNAISMGSGVIDGAILGWKLYRKFKRK